MKVIPGRRWFLLVFWLREAGLAQATVALEQLAALTEDWLRADGGEFVAPVRLVKSTVCNPASAQSFHALEKLAFA